MKKALWKDFFRSIRFSLNRFLSILLIVALGVAFYSGIRATSPDMKNSADQYYDASNLMDIRVLSTWGLNQKDINYLKSVAGADQVMPGYSCDVMGSINANQYLLKVYSVQEPINQPDLAEGRMPEKEDECVIDARLTKLDEFAVGKTLTMQSGNEEKLEDTLHRHIYTIVGVINSSYYMDQERGSASIGDGSIDGYVMIPESNFALNVYTEAYLTVKGAKELPSYSDAYQDQVEAVRSKIEDWSDQRAETRYLTTMKKAQRKVEDGEKKVRDGEKELKDGKQDLKDGEKKIEDKEQEIKDGKKEIAEAKEQLKDARKQIEDGRTKLAVQKKEAQEKLAKAKMELDEQETKLVKSQSELNAKKKEADQKIEDGQKQLDAGKKELDAAKVKIDQMAAAVPEDTPDLTAAQSQYSQQLAAWQTSQKELTAQKTKAEKEFSAAQRQLTSGEKQLESGKTAYEQQKSKMEQEFAKAERELTDSEAKLASGEKKITENEKKLADGQKKLDKARKDLDEGQRKITKAENKIAKAKKKLTDAKEQLTDLDKPEYYVLDRESIISYVAYGQDADRIKAIGNVFPVIFFLVAALVSLTTMTRMVEGERTQIGTMKAMGYSKANIAMKYLFYAFLASALGSIVGIFLGQKTLPPIIITAYKLMYEHLPHIVSPLNLNYSITSALAAILTTTLATLASCYAELSAAPAVLMRPAAPKAGKRVLLERIPWIWKHLNFTKKVTLRNLIRYKKRFLMTVFGIGGCMALLLVGFGVRDSIFSIIDIQYNKTMKYDVSVGVDDGAKVLQKQELDQQLADNKNITERMKAYQVGLDVSKGDTTKAAYLVVPEDADRINDFCLLNDRKTDEIYPLKEDGVVITEKLAKLLDVKAGDTITLKEGDEKNSVTITAVSENHLYHYVYMPKDLYQKIYQKDFTYNEILVKMKDSSDSLTNQMSEQLLKLDAVNSVTLQSATESTTSNMLKGMNVVIYVLIISAGALAFVVLYNLNNINISERKRELATIKVLGFYDLEVAEYVYRENILLTFIGTFAGVFLGIVMHHYVIVTAELDILMFGRDIYPKSFLYSILLTIGFSMFVNFILYFKLRKIDMVESLKSIE